MGTPELVFTPQMAWAIGLTVATLLLFLTEWLPVEGISILILICLSVTQIVDQDKVLTGFANQAPWMVASLFILGGAMLHTGIVQTIAHKLEQWSGGSPVRLLIILLLLVMVVSAVLNNTTVVAVFLPICVNLSRRFGVSPSRFLLPLSYATILGGTCTLIGTSTNVVVASFADVLKFDPIGMFDMTAAGVLFAGVGLLYLIVTSRRLIPDRAPKPAMISGDIRRLYVTDLQVGANSPLIGLPIDEIQFDAPEGQCQVLHIVRGEDLLQPGTDEARVQDGDLLLVEIAHEQIDRIREKYGLSLHADHHLRSREAGAEPVILAEVLIHPESGLIGRRLSDLHFRLSHHVVVLAMSRRARILDHGFAGLPLAAGDILLVCGSEPAVQRLENSRDVRLLSRGLEEKRVRHRHANTSLIILAAFIAVCALFESHINIAVVSMTAAAFLVSTGCLSMRQAYDSIDWRVVLMLGSSISLGHALDHTGASKWLAGYMVRLAEPLGPQGIILGIYLGTAILTEFISNNAAAALITPFAFATAQNLGLDPMAFLMAVLFGASSAFATPVGYQTNLFVYGPGGYRFKDFLMMGIPLKILMTIVAYFVLPAFWPLESR